MTPNQSTKQDVARLVNYIYVCIDSLDIKALRAYIDILEMERDDIGNRWGYAILYPEEGYDSVMCEAELASAEYMLEQVRVLARYRRWRGKQKQEFISEGKTKWAKSYTK